MYEEPASPSYKGITVSPRERENKSEEELSPTGAMVQFAPVPSTAILGTSMGLSTHGTLVVKVLENNTSCPRCGNQIGKISGLVDHLKRPDGRKKIVFTWSCCGRTDVKHHSVACRFLKCKGVVEAATVIGWMCEEYKRVLETKIGLGQHKHLAHPVTGNTE